MRHTSDIDRFAEQAGFPARRAFSDLSDLYPRLERFAALVLANHPPQSSMAWQEGYEAGASAKREKVAEEIFDMCKEGWWDSEGMRHHWSKRGQA